MEEAHDSEQLDSPDLASESAYERGERDARNQSDAMVPASWTLSLSESEFDEDQTMKGMFNI